MKNTKEVKVMFLLALESKRIAPNVKVNSDNYLIDRSECLDIDNRAGRIIPFSCNDCKFCVNPGYCGLKMLTTYYKKGHYGKKK